MSAFLNHSGLIGSMRVIALIDVEDGIEKGGPHTEGQSEDEDLIEPALFERLADKSPAPLHLRLAVPFRYHLSLPSYINHFIPKTGLVVCEKGMVRKFLGVYSLILL